MNDVDLLNPRAVVGDNHAPLAMILEEETAEIRGRASLLVDSAGRATVKDEETAQKSVLLAGLLKEHLGIIDKAREARKRPFLESGRTVDAHYNAIAATIALTDSKGKVIGGPLHTVLTLVDEYRRKKEAEAAAVRRRLEEEAHQQRLAAEAAERARIAAEERERQAAEDAARRIREAEENARLANTRAEREKAQREAAEAKALRDREEAAARERQRAAAIAALEADAAAEKLERQAAATVAAPVVSAYGPKTSRRTVWIVEIDDLSKAIAHARRIDEATVRACIQSIYEKQVRAGVRTLLGATVREDSSTQIRTK